MRRGHSVRAYVVRLVVAVALPFLVFAAFLLIRSADNEQLAIATTAQERAEDAAADLEQELRHLQDLVSILANSDYLFVSDVAVSRHRATGLLRDLALGLAVRNLSGEPLFDTCTADAEPFPVSRRPEEALYETDSAKSHISVVTKPVSGEPYLTIDLPVRREGESVWIVSLCTAPHSPGLNRAASPQWLDRGGRGPPRSTDCQHQRVCRRKLRYRRERSEYGVRRG